MRKKNNMFPCTGIIRILKNLLFIFLFHFLLYSCTEQNNTTISKDLEISYYPMKEVSKRMVVRVSCNGSEEEYFMLDSGHASDLIMLDSAYFYESVNANELEPVKQKYRMAFWWSTFYKGKVNVNIAGKSFCIDSAKVEVTTQFQEKNRYRYPRILGLLGVDAFLDKITILNFKENLIGFTDMLNTDFDINNFIVVDLVQARTITETNKDYNYRFISIDGFKTTDGNKKKGLFLLDTGCSTDLVMKSSFGKDLKYEKQESRKSGFTYGAYEWVWRSDTLILGDGFKTNNIEVSVCKLPPDQDKLEILAGGDGVIGLSFLKRFDMVIFDFINNKLYLKIV